MAEIVPYSSTTNNKVLKCTVTAEEFRMEYSSEFMDGLAQEIAKAINKEIVESMKNG